MSIYKVTVKVGKKTAGVVIPLTVLAKDRKAAVRIAEDDVRTAMRLKSSHTVMGTVAA